MKPETQQKINQLQLIEENLRVYSQQRQQFSAELLEVESASKEIKSTSQSFKIIGTIMVAASAADLERELGAKREKYELRLKSLEKQEDKLKERAKALQQEVMADLG
jgi:prefoldin beta subunit